MYCIKYQFIVCVLLICFPYYTEIHGKYSMCHINIILPVLYVEAQVKFHCDPCQVFVVEKLGLYQVVSHNIGFTLSRIIPPMFRVDARPSTVDVLWLRY
jgi:hypothetical protein